MLVRSLGTILIIASTFILATGQTPDVKVEDANAKATRGTPLELEPLRDLPFADGVNLQYLVKELTRDLSLNVLFDSESRLEARVVRIDLRAVTPTVALNNVLLQEGLGFAEVGPKTILVASRSRLGSIPKSIGVIAVLQSAAAKSSGGTRLERLRDVPFPGGVDLQYIVKELAKDLDLNVLFDSESRLEARKIRIELKNVTSAAAINYILLQEGLVSEEAGPRTILVAHRIRATGVPQIGVGVTPLTEQLAQYFGVKAGVLINNVHADSPGSKAGLIAGDVIVGIDAEPVYGTLGLIQSLGDKKESDVTLRIVRERREQTVNLRLF